MVGYPKLDHMELHLPCVHKYPDSLSTTQTKNKPLRHKNSKIFAVSMQDLTCNTKLKTLSYFPAHSFIIIAYTTPVSTNGNDDVSVTTFPKPSLCIPTQCICQVR